MRCSTLIVAAICLLRPVMAAAGPLTIGVLEQRPSGDSGSALQYDLRAGFEKVGTDWVTKNATPDPGTRWSIYFRGKLLGTVESSSSIKSDDAHAGALHVADGHIPSVGSPTKEFAGWLDARSQRPLLAVTEAPASVASRWTEDKAHPELLTDVWPEFEKLVASINPCTKSGDAAGAHKVIPSDVKPLSGWRSSSGEQLLRFETDPRLESSCEIKETTDVWFIRSADGHVRPLPGQVWDGGTNSQLSADMKLIDSGTFGGDGDEGAVFFLSGYDLDGYVLYYDHFQKFARLTWSYH